MFSQVSLNGYNKQDMEIIEYPPIYGLFQKRIEGDNALLKLASVHFEKIYMGAEFYSESIDELRWLMGFNPISNRLPIVHLNRDLNLFKESDTELILNFAGSFQNRIYGIVIHDQFEIETQFEKFLQLLSEIDLSLKQMNNPLYIFIEYAVGLPFELFVSVFENILDTKKVSACIDTGHIGIKQIKSAYALNNNGNDINKINLNDLKNPAIRKNVNLAIQSALPTVLDVVGRLGKLSKPLHFHLHDGHPLWHNNSSFGLSDHFSFLENIVVPLNKNESLIVEPMYGKVGLLEIVKSSLNVLSADQISYTLEIHPRDRRRPLGNFSYLFDHWHDKTNAEMMNHWIYILEQNHKILLEDIFTFLRRDKR